MKLSHLIQILKYLQQFERIVAIHRVNDTTVKIVFDKDQEIYFQMQRSNSFIFKCQSFARTKIYNAPFDVLLAKRFNRSKILEIRLLNNDKVLQIKTSLSLAYKEEITYLQFEFTGKNTNVIITDADSIVLEALRHVDIYSSFREVRVGQKLDAIPEAPYTPKEYPLDNVEMFLYDSYAKEEEKKLVVLKKQKIAYLEKKLGKLQKIYEALEDESSLEDEAMQMQNYGNLILSNMHSIKPYVRELQLLDYDGETIKISLEKAYRSAAEIADSFFAKSKKAKQRSKNLHIERVSLESKMNHLRLFINTVEQANDQAKIALLFPKKEQIKRIKQNDSIETFFVEGYKVSLGKNEKGNIEVLQQAKARDIWLHLKERPSCHVVITTDKQNVPNSVIQSAGRLCVDFTTAQKDKFLVDYTPRREVNIQNGANVLYNKYSTIEIDTRD